MGSRVARGPLHDRTVPSPVKNKPSASPPEVQRPAHKSDDNKDLSLQIYTCSKLVYISAGPQKRLAAFCKCASHNRLLTCASRGPYNGMSYLLERIYQMPSDRTRILGLALESLLEKKKKLDQEIAEITRELRGKAPLKGAPAPAVPAKKRSQFSKEERLRRSRRMKAYWDNWRKKKNSRKPA